MLPSSVFMASPYCIPELSDLHLFGSWLVGAKRFGGSGRDSFRNEPCQFWSPRSQKWNFREEHKLAGFDGMCAQCLTSISARGSSQASLPSRLPCSGERRFPQEGTCCWPWGGGQERLSKSKPSHTKALVSSVSMVLFYDGEPLSNWPQKLEDHHRTLTSWICLVS